MFVPSYHPTGTDFWEVGALMGSCHSNCHDAFFFFGGGGECLPTIQGEIPTTSDYKRIVCDELNIYIYIYVYIYIELSTRTIHCTIQGKSL